MEKVYSEGNATCFHRSPALHWHCGRNTNQCNKSVGVGWVLGLGDTHFCIPIFQFFRFLVFERDLCGGFDPLPSLRTVNSSFNNSLNLFLEVALLHEEDMPLDVRDNKMNGRYEPCCILQDSINNMIIFDSTPLSSHKKFLSQKIW